MYPYVTVPEVRLKNAVRTCEGLIGPGELRDPEDSEDLETVAHDSFIDSMMDPQNTQLYHGA